MSWAQLFPFHNPTVIITILVTSRCPAKQQFGCCTEQQAKSRTAGIQTSSEKGGIFSGSQLRIVRPLVYQKI